MEDFKKNLEALFNVEPAKEVKKSRKKTEEDADESAEFAKIKLKKLITMGEDALLEIEQIARSTGDPKAFQAFNNLLKTVGDLSTNVLKNDGEKVKIDKLHHDMDKQAKGSPKSVTNNTMVFTGTTADLLKGLKADDKAAAKTIEHEAATETPKTE